MTDSTRKLLEAFDSLTVPEREEVFAAILRRPTLSEREFLEQDDVVEAADRAFWELEASSLDDAAWIQARLSAVQWDSPGYPEHNQGNTARLSHRRWHREAELT